MIPNCPNPDCVGLPMGEFVEEGVTAYLCSYCSTVFEAEEETPERKAEREMMEARHTAYTDHMWGRCRKCRKDKPCKKLDALRLAVFGPEQERV